MDGTLIRGIVPHIVVFISFHGPSLKWQIFKTTKIPLPKLKHFNFLRLLYFITFRKLDEFGDASPFFKVLVTRCSTLHQVFD